MILANGTDKVEAIDESNKIFYNKADKGDFEKKIFEDDLG